MTESLDVSQGIYYSSFSTRAWQNSSCKEGDKKMGHSAISKVVTKVYTNNIHKHIHGVGLKKCAPQALKDIRYSP